MYPNFPIYSNNIIFSKEIESFVYDTNIPESNEEINLDLFIKIKPSSPDQFAKYLYFSPYSPQIIYILLKKKDLFNIKFLFYYFSSPKIEYIPFNNFLECFFSRIAIPSSKEEIIILFESIGSVFETYSHVLPMGSYSFTHTIVCFFYYFYMKLINQPLDDQKFSKILKSHNSSKFISKQLLSKLISIKNECNFSLFFTFSHPNYSPNLEKNGYLTATIGLFGTNKKVFVIIEQFSLKMYKDDSKKVEIGGIPLLNINFLYLENTKYSFTIQSDDNIPVGYVLQGGKPIIQDPGKLILIVDSLEELESWRSSIMHVSFLKTMNNLTIMPPWKDNNIC